MARTLYEDFLDNEDQYRMSEELWARLTDTIARSLGQADAWQPWMPTTYGDGATPLERDGNPIYNARSKDPDRAFRIVQIRPRGEQLEFAAWVKSYEAEYDLPRDELVINLSLSDEAIVLAETLLREWMMPQTTRKQMEELITRLRPTS